MLPDQGGTIVMQLLATLLIAFYLLTSAATAYGEGACGVVGDWNNG